jgi:hypothetical protein
MALWKRILLAVIPTTIAAWAAWHLYTFGCYFMACFFTAPIAFGVFPIAIVMIVRLFFTFNNKKAKWLYIIYFATIIATLTLLFLVLSLRSFGMTPYV